MDLKNPITELEEKKKKDWRGSKSDSINQKKESKT